MKFFTMPLAFLLMLSVNCGASFDCGVFEKIGDVSDSLEKVLTSEATIGDLDKWAAEVNQQPESVRADTQRRINAALDAADGWKDSDKPDLRVPEKVNAAMRTVFNIGSEGSEIAKSVCEAFKNQPTQAGTGETKVTFGRE